MVIKVVDTFVQDTDVLESVIGNGVQNAILNNRGFESQEQKDYMIHADISLAHDPSLLKDADKAAETIIKWLGGEITVYSDYDADGWGSLLVLVILLRRLGAKVNYFTNSRAIGFGANIKGLELLLSKYPNTNLIITSDNGIVSFDAVDEFNSRGIEVIITDHHTPDPSGRLPNATAVVNPKRLDDTYPFKGLCGAGVAWKLMLLVYKKLSRPIEETYEMLDIVAFSTVGDVVPLVDENRLIVKYGLGLINNSPREEWDILREVNSTFYKKIKIVDEQTLGFTFVPQVNACSRLLGSIEDPCEIFLNPDRDVKVAEAKYIKGVNEERKSLSNDQTERAYTLCEGLNGTPAVVISASIFDDGIVGIIAGRIKEALWAPAIVLSQDPDEPDLLRGSGRSIEGFDLFNALDSIQKEKKLLAKYGGHAMACGLSLKKENLDAFRTALCEKALSVMNPTDYERKLFVDLDIHDDEAASFVADSLKELAPYGTGFPAPIVRLKNFKVQEVSFKGAEKQHLFLKGKNITVLSWNGANDYQAKGSPMYVTAYGALENVTEGLQLNCESSLILNA